jgi:hypothetical protein
MLNNFIPWLDVPISSLQLPALEIVSIQCDSAGADFSKTSKEVKVFLASLYFSIWPSELAIQTMLSAPRQMEVMISGYFLLYDNVSFPSLSRRCNSGPFKYHRLPALSPGYLLPEIPAGGIYKNLL